MVSARLPCRQAPRRTSLRTDESRTTRQSTNWAVTTTGRTPCGDEPERTMPPCSPFGARMQWPEPAQHRAEPGAQLRLTKGGAVRTRIALSTALAVLIVVPVLLFALSSSNPVASAQSRHEAGSRHRAARIDMKLMSYAQAEKITKLATFYNAVTAQRRADVPQGDRLPPGVGRATIRGGRASHPSGHRFAPGPCGRRLGWHEHQHARLGMHPSARVGRKLRRGRRRCLSIRTRYVGSPYRPEHPG